MNPDFDLIHDDFLLETKHARRLYHDYAEDMPIFDYHCHLPPDQIAANRTWADMAEIWLGGDHYKWRAMRTNGVEERFCTGDAKPYEKFKKWAETVPHTLRNPLFHWTHLELKRYFGVKKLLTPSSAKEIWETCNEKLATPDFTCRRLIERAKVKVICTTDDPVDTLEHHRAIAKDTKFKTKILPAWRPDKGMAPENLAAFNAWIDALGERAKIDIGGDFDNYMAALEKRHAFFHKNGCRLSDHGLETIYAEDYTEADIKAIFKKARGGTGLNGDEILKFKSCMLHEFGKMDHKRGWTQQYHYGALRSKNSRMLAKLGPDTGFDSIGDFTVGEAMAKFFDRLDKTDKLAPTIIYNLNPRDNALVATMIGNFQDGSKPGKIQFGSGWWFLDQEDGMKAQIEALSQMGLLSRFVGMLTDSRSFLSYPRHEYFRRVLCNILGNDIAAGKIPQDYEWVGKMLKDICYKNAKNYFGFEI